jgi:hypothetical protein
MPDDALATFSKGNGANSCSAFAETDKSGYFLK